MQNMRIDETSDLFYECVTVETSKHKLISNQFYLERKNILISNRITAISK